MFFRRLVTLASGLVLVFAATARAASGNVVVFPLDVQNAELDPGDATLLQRALEDDLGPALASLGYTVLTDENARELLKTEAIDVNAVRHGRSYLEVARALKLALFVTEQGTAADGHLTVDVRLFDVATGRMIASGEVDGEDGATLRQSWHGARSHFIATAKQSLAAAPATSANAAAPSPAALKELYAACDRSEPSKCLKLGQLYEKGIGVPASKHKAEDYYGRACSGGYPEGCAALRNLRMAEMSN